MAIRIPSKSIYEKNNPKIRDNNIRKVEVGNVKNKLETEYNKLVYESNSKSSEITINKTYTGYKRVDFTSTDFVEKYLRSYAYMEVDINYLQPTTTSFPILGKNSYTKNVYYGVEETEENIYNSKIKSEITYQVTKEDIEIPFTNIGDKIGFATGDDWLKEVEKGEIEVMKSYAPTNEATLPIEFEEKIVKFNNIILNNINYLRQLKFFYEYPYTIKDDALTWTSTATINEYANCEEAMLISSISKSTNDSFKINLSQSQLKYFKVGEISVISVGFGALGTDPNVTTVTFKGTRKTYTPLEGTFTFYGDTVTLKSEDSTEILGDANSKQVTSFDGNELMQKRIPFYTEKCYFHTTGELTYSNQFYCTKELVKVDVNEIYKVDIYNFASGTAVHSACVFDENKKFLAFIRYLDGFKIDVENAYYIGINFINTNGTSELNGKEYYEVNGQIFSVVDNYNKIIRSYQNGKETATIRCSIVDYYDENGELVVSPSQSYSYDYTQHATNGNAYVQMDEDGYVTIPTRTEMMYADFNKVIEVDLPYGEYELSISEMSSDISGFVQLDHSTEFPNAEEEYYRISFTESEPKTVKFNVNSIKETFYLHLDVLLTDTSKTFKVEINGKKTKMLFEQYDEVIPMIIDKDGQDKPMSFYKDGNPKKFKVLSVRPYFDGAVWQELSLQEIDN